MGADGEAAGARGPGKGGEAEVEANCTLLAAEP